MPQRPASQARNHPLPAFSVQQADDHVLLTLHLTLNQADLPVGNLHARLSLTVADQLARGLWETNDDQSVPAWISGADQSGAPGTVLVEYNPRVKGQLSLSVQDQGGQPLGRVTCRLDTLITELWN